MIHNLSIVATMTLAILAQGCASTVTPIPQSAALAPSSDRAADPNADAGVAADATSSAVNRAALPLDDYHYTTGGPRVGWVYSCQPSFSGQGASVDGPWIDQKTGTWNSLTKIAVEGDVSWVSKLTSALSGSSRRIAGNGLPSHATGTFPISPTDPAYQYDQNPNSIEAQHVDDAIPAHPKRAAQASCANMGPVGVMLTGAQLYNALDGTGRDAAAHEVLDKCNGHPDQSGTYHYHAPSPCMSDPGTGHSRLLGYALDGFGIYGVRGVNGKVLSSTKLDACHGHTHAILWNGKRVVMYHYHMTYDYPYSIGCYRGTPIATQRGGPP